MFTRMFCLLVSGLIFAITPAYAGTEPLYAPQPEWADSTALQAYLDTGRKTAGGFVGYDRQIMVRGDALTTYTELVFEASSPELLAQFGNLKAGWLPEKGDLTINRVEIIRKTGTIDALAGGKKFTILRREAGLEQLELNGVLTAVAQIDDLRIGDRLRFAFTITSRDPSLDGHAQTSEALFPKPFPLGFGRIRVYWPTSDTLAWQTSGVGIGEVLSRINGYNMLEVSEPIIKQPDYPESAPLRFTPIPYLEMSNFDSWSDVSQSVAKLYTGRALASDSGDLIARVDGIAATSKDPVVRAAAALRLVQDDVRYLYNGLGTGNYVPQTPADTWRLRYGDCKAKTLLLLAILDRLGIAAEPALVSTEWKDAVPMRLPSYGVFNHIMVRADINGQTYWLDGTKNGDRLPDLADTPEFRFALPVLANGSALEELALRPQARPFTVVEMEMDARAGISLPTLFKAKLALRGAAFQSLKTSAGAGEGKELNDRLNTMLSEYIENAIPTSRSLTIDDDAGIAYVTYEGVQSQNWDDESGVFALSPQSIMDGFNYELDRGRAAWKAIPVATPYPAYYQSNARIQLPPGSADFTLQGEAKIDANIGGYAIVRNASLAGDTFRLDESWRPVEWEVAADQIPSVRSALARIKNSALKVKAPADFPDRYAELALARKNGRLAAIEKAYATNIAYDTSKVAAYSNRAAFYAGILELQKAAADVQVMLDLEPDAATYLWRANILYEIDPKAAIADARSALELDPVNAGATGVLVEIYNEMQDGDAALAVVDDAEANGLDDITVASLRSDVLIESRQPEAAVAVLDKIIADKPGNADLLNSRCWAKARAKLMLDTALKDCTKAIELADSPAAILDSRGMVYYQLGQLEDAKADYDAALKIAPGLAPSLYMRGIIHLRQGNTDSGRKDIAKARLISSTVAKMFARYGVMP